MTDNNKYSMENLFEDSLEVFKGMKVFHPWFGMDETLDMTKEIKNFPGRYAVFFCSIDFRILTIGFVYDNTYYVTPFTHKAIKTLKENGFERDIFEVPLVYTEYPCDKKMRNRWLELKEKSHQVNDEIFIKLCINSSKKKGLGSISEAVLAKCFEMPYANITGRTKKGSYKCYKPILKTDVFGTSDAEMLGIYCVKNGITVFSYCNGHTYVSKGTKIVSELKKAGFKESDLEVPFSDSEMEFDDKVLQERWDSLAEY